MIVLKNKETGAALGELSDRQLQFLVDALEEEHDADQDYWIHREQIEAFRRRGADPGLLDMLARAIGGREGIEVIWERDCPPPAMR
jgi:hypothetical protein